MLRKSLLLTVLCALNYATFAGGFSYEKSIDVSAVVPSGAQLKAIAADSLGNVYFTTFQSSSNYIYKITDPAGSASVAVFNQDGAFFNTDAACLAVDTSGNVYLSGYSATDGSDAFIRKYRSDGTLDPTFGNNGVVSPVVIGGANVRPRALAYVPSANVLLVSIFGSPYTLGTIDCATGAGSATTIQTKGDQDDKASTAFGNDIFMGVAYDPVAQAIYGNAQCDLMKVTASGTPDLGNLSSFDTFQALTLHGRQNYSTHGLAFDPTTRLVAYTAMRCSDTSSGQMLGVYDLNTATEILVGAAPGKPGFINGGGAPAFVRSGSTLYLAALSALDRKVHLYRYSPPMPAPKWEWVTTVDVSSAIPTGGKIKSLAADANGNLYFTTFYGTGNIHYIKKVANPLGTPVITQFNSDEAYASNSGADVTVDNDGNVYLCYQGADGASSWIKKYDSSGNLVTSFGTNGKLQPVVIGGVQVRPRSISYTPAEGGRLIVTAFSAAPYYMGTILASTGADGGPMRTMLGDSNDDGVVAENELWMGTAYVASQNAIYGNAMGDLLKFTGTAATLSNMTTFDTLVPVSLHRRLFTDNINLKADPLGRWLAYTAIRDSYLSAGSADDRMLIGVYDLATGEEELVGSYANALTSPPYLGYIKYGGNPAFFQSGGQDYLAVTSHYTNAIEIFRYNPQAGVDAWSLY